MTFTGDDPSSLLNPSFVAKAGETNRVTLLIGKTYRVTCPMPFVVAGKSSDDIEESWEENGPHCGSTGRSRSARKARKSRPRIVTDCHGLGEGESFGLFLCASTNLHG